MIEHTDNPLRAGRWPRWVRGVLSTLGGFVAFMGRFGRRWLKRFRTPERYDRGLIVMLPGIESESLFDHSVVWGLDDGGWQGAIEIDDWTTSNGLLFCITCAAGGGTCDRLSGLPHGSWNIRTSSPAGPCMSSAIQAAAR